MREEKIRRRDELRKKNKKKRSGVLPIILTTLIACAVLILSGFYYMTTPVDKNNNNEVKVEIKENYGSAAIADELKSKGLIKNATVFKLYSRASSSASFYVGTFNLKPSMNLSEIMAVLTNKDNAKLGNSISVIEGDNVEKIAKTVASKTNITEEDFLATVNDLEFINQLKAQFPDLITDDIKNEDIRYALEGYLYPAVYDIKGNETAQSIITKMVKLTNDKVVPKYKADNRLWKLNNQEVKPTIHEYITMASILEKESTYDGDNNKIAGVFLNRLGVDMPLQTDPTVYYSVGRTTGGLSVTELQNQNPYNTYAHKGLPPGPIASAGMTSYDALNNAEDHEYLYFLNAKDGKAYFAKTYQEHEELAKEHIEGYVATGSQNN